MRKQDGDRRRISTNYEDRQLYYRRRRRRYRRKRAKLSFRFGVTIAIALLTFALLIASLSTARMVLTASDRADPVLVANVLPLGFSEGDRSEVSLATRHEGDRVSLNGKTFSGAWIQWQDNGETRTGLSDTAAMAILGVELLDTQNPNIQPVRWFNFSQPLPVHFGEAYRYLDITDLLDTSEAQVQVNGSILSINAPSARIQSIKPTPQPPPKRGSSDRDTGGQIIISLDRPTFWQLSQNPREGVVMLEGSGYQELPLDEEPLENENSSPDLKAFFHKFFTTLQTQTSKLNTKIEGGEFRTKIHVDLTDGNQLRVTSTASPPQLIVDVRPDVLSDRNIVIAPGLLWQQRYIASSPPLGLASREGSRVGQGSGVRFPVTSLTFNPRDPKIALKPIWGNPRSMQGTEPLVVMGRQWKAFAAINGGFFNRNNRLPLGAIRRDGKWFSGPILNRGAIAWDDQGNIAIDRLYLRETLITSYRQRLFISFLNSGYVQAGIARYTTEWGDRYIPMTDNETIAIVEGDRVTQQVPGGKAGESSFPIPSKGYLLTLRGNSASPRDLEVGTQVRLESDTVPPQFANYPQIIGAGPLLLKNGQIVLNASEEKFSNAFNGQAASRSLIGTTRQGTLVIAAIHNRPRGRGPTLAELAQLAQRLDLVDALNLDGGSSTSFYLGGQLVDRSPVTAARVHNGIGIYLR